MKVLKRTEPWVSNLSDWNKLAGSFPNPQQQLAPEFPHNLNSMALMGV